MPETPSERYTRLEREYCWNETRFWTLVDEAAGSRERLEQLLIPVSRTELIGFQWTYEARLAEIFGAIQTLTKVQSEDAVDDYCASIVARGRSTYAALLQGPASADPEAPYDAREQLRWAANEVYRRRFNAELPPYGYDDEAK